MYTLKFLVLSIKNWTHTSEYLSGNQTHSETVLSYVFSLSTMHITDHIHFNVIFILIISDERQNVVVKTNIFTMFHNLKPRTIFISTRGRSIPLFIWQLIEKLSIIDLVRANKQEMILWCGWLKWPTSQPPTKKIICEMTFLTCYSEDWCVLLCMDRS